MVVSLNISFNIRDTWGFFFAWHRKRDVAHAKPSIWRGSVRVAERLALPTSDHGVADSNPAGDEILLEPKRRFITQSLSCSPFHHLEMTEILLKGHKILTHPSIHSIWREFLILSHTEKSEYFRMEL